MSTLAYERIRILEAKIRQLEAEKSQIQARLEDLIGNRKRRLYVDVKRGETGRAILPCAGCHRETQIRGRGLCAGCYTRWRRAQLLNLQSLQ